MKREPVIPPGVDPQAFAYVEDLKKQAIINFRTARSSMWKERLRIIREMGHKEYHALSRSEKE
jgi:hypothetical protein